MRKLLLGLLPVFFCALAFGQHRGSCAFEVMHKNQLSLNKSYDSSVRRLDARWTSYAALASGAMLTYTSAGYVYEIPTVVHVIHTGGSVGSLYNPDSTKIAQMIAYLNASYAAASPFPDTTHGGCRIPLKFVLARRTPAGASTNGIIRVDASSLSGYSSWGVNVSLSSGVSDNTIKSLSRWSPADYYNIYCVNKIDGNDLYSGGGIAGYAYFPGSPSQDGMIVVAAEVTAGSTTVSHELGHAFGLYHTFEGDAGGTTCPSTTSCSTTGDLICDTEPHIRESSAFPSTWCPPTDYNSCTGRSYNYTQYNIMDYTECPPDRFTAGQRTRMLNTLDNERVGYKTSAGLLSPSGSITTVSCTPTSSSIANVGPVMVSFNGMNVWTGDAYAEQAAYADHAYTQQSSVRRGNTYTISVNTELNKQNVRVFIDYNNDGDFADAGEQVFSHNGTSIPETHSGSITIPATAVTCAYLRMRVVSVFYSATPSDYACGPYTYGQAEDYGVYVVSDTPAVTSPVTLCQGVSASALTASGSNLKWYTAATGGTGVTALIPSTATIGSTTYYVSQSGDGSATCESSRSALVVNVIAPPAAPAVTSPVTYCQGATASALTATGSSLLWYSAASGGTGSTTATVPSTATAGTFTYYVSQTSGGCESPRAAITVNITAAPAAPTVSTPVTYCIGASAVALTASGSSLQWYTLSSGGTGSTIAPVPSTASAGTTTYYVSQKPGTCESSRAAIAVTVKAVPGAPSVASMVVYCQGSTSVPLSASGAAPGDTLLWYTAATGGAPSYIAPTPSTTSVGSNTSWVSLKSAPSCEGSRSSITVNVNANPTAPTVSTPVSYCRGDLATALTATKSSGVDTLYWYTAATGGLGSATAPVPSTATAGLTNYWVSSRNNLSCESSRTAISVQVNALPLSPSVTAVSYCQGASAAPLTATPSVAGDTLYWYTTASGGTGSLTPPTPATTATGVTTYYVSERNTNKCESVRTAITVTVNAVPAAPSVVSPVIYCQGAVAVALSATKSAPSDTLLWYSTAIGGTASYTAPISSTASAGTSSWWVSLKSAPACESGRSAISVTINPGPAAPVVSTPVSYCRGDISVALTATKASGTDTLYWYTVATGGVGSLTAPVPATATAGITNYWVSSKSALSCEGSRAAIAVQVNALPAAPSANPVAYCRGAVAAPLTATPSSAGDTLYWYSTATGGTGSLIPPTPATTSTGITTYYVSERNANKCESARTAITVTVNAIPAAPSVVTPVGYCQGATALALIAAKSAPTDTLLWYTAATGGTASYTAPVPSTVFPGTTTWWVSLKSAAACEGGRSSILVAISPNPAAPAVTSPVSYCQGDPATALTATKASGTDTLYWYSTATGGTGSLTAPVPSTATAGLTSYWVSSRNILTCEGSRAIIAVQVNALPASPVVNAVTYCQGAVAVPLTATPSAAGDTLYWYTAATGGTGSLTAPTPATAATGVTTYYVSERNSNKCESPRAAIVVTVNRTPSAPTVVSPVLYCQGASTAPLIALKTVFTDTLLWYTTAAGGTASYTTPVPSTLIPGATNWWVSIKSSAACESSRSSILVAVSPNPAAPAVISPVSYCQGDPATALTATKASGTDTLYWYSTATGGSGSLTAPIPSTATSGTTNYWVGSRNVLTCESIRTNISVQVNALPSSPSTTSVTYCQGATALPLIATPSAAGDTLYWYTTASGGTGSRIAPTPSTGTPGITTYYVSERNMNKCESPRAAITVTVNLTPAAPAVVSPVTYCQGATAVALSAAKSAPSDTLLWYTAASGGASVYTAPVPSTVSAGTNTWWVSLKTAAACEGNRSAITVTVNPLPLAPAAASPVTYCKGDVATALTATGASGTDTLYWYTVATGGTGSLTAPIPSTATAGLTGYWVSSRNTLNCESSRVRVNVQVNDLPLAPVVSPVVYCQGAAAVPLTATASSAGDTLYWYTVATGGTASLSAPTPTTSATGVTTYYVSERNSNKCESPRAMITVTVNPTPAAPSVTSPLNLCIGSAATALTASGTGLLWYVAAIGGTGSATAPVPSTAALGTTTYYVSQTNSFNCESARSTLSVAVQDLPAAPAVVSPVTYCQGATATALTATKPSATDTLYWYTTATGGTGVTAAPVPATGTVGSTTVYAGARSRYGCTGTLRAAIVVTVNPTPVLPTVTSPVVYCQNAIALALNATAASAGDTLKWYTAATGGTGSNTAIVPATATAGTVNYYVSAKNVYGCEGPRAPIAVTVNALPAAPVVVSPVNLCVGGASSPLTATGTALLWYTSLTGTGSSTAPAPSTAAIATVLYYVTQTNTTTGCESPKATINVVVNPLPSVPVVITPLDICMNSVASRLGAGGTSLLWYTAATGGTGSATAPIPVTTAVGSFNYYVSQTSSVGCEGPRALLAVNVRPLPVVTVVPKTVPGFVYCPGKTVTLLASSTLPVTYQWYQGSLLLSGATSDTLAAGTTSNYKVVATTVYGCTDDTVISVTQDVAPVLTPPESTICENASVLLVCHPGYTGSLFDWKKDGFSMTPATPKANTRNVTASGSYTVTVTSIYGCVATTNSTSVSYYPKPVRPVIGRVGSTLYLSPSTGYIYYQWFRNGSVIAGANSSSYTYIKGGLYHAEVTDRNGCIANSDTAELQATSVPQMSLNTEIKVHPNPTNGKLQIEAPLVIHAELSDMMGRRLIYVENAQSIDLKDLPDGTYVLRLYDESRQLIAVEKINKVTWQ
ncbi:GEVED domain-containing protein [Rurimicrobium arvi]